MMFNRKLKKEISILEDRLTYLENELHSLRQAAFHRTYESFYDRGYNKGIPISTVVKQILQHLSIDVVCKPAQSAEYVLKKKESNGSVS